MELKDSITAIKGIGEKTSKLFAKLGVLTAGDLLEYYPKDYEVYQPPVPISGMQEGETAAIQAVIAAVPQIRRGKNLNILTVQVRDYSGCISLTWFNMLFLQSSLKMGVKYIFRGKAVRKNGVLVLEQPKILGEQEYYNKLSVLQPLYSLTAGLTNNGIVKAVGNALSETDLIGDYLPVSIRRECNLCDYKKSVRQIHFPKNIQEVEEARKRIVFDEFFLFNLSVKHLKNQKQKRPGLKLTHCDDVGRLVEELPYRLTSAQKRVFGEIEADLAGEAAMNRLVQGDVGSGKTILAAMALLMCAKSGYQAAMMAPTEVLAKQHYETLTGLLSPFGVKTVLLTGSMTAREKREVTAQIKNHEADVITGTHALIQEKVEYDRLALAVTDEQHRFGVRQREALSGKGQQTHILVMSATPIPRTLAIILYGDLDISVIDELPSDRLPIKNCVVNTPYRPTAVRFIEKEVNEGRQAYVICPMVEESEALEAENVIDYTQNLRELLDSGLTVEYLHGKMKPKEKNDIMERFASGEIQILVSTTVVEVGINVPNATVMLVENAERFGLAQLHQLRGRVGRGGHQSYCIFMSGSSDRKTMERLAILNKSNDGFYISSEDLKLRGPGDLFGIRQSGVLAFRMADVYQDAELLVMANKAAAAFTEQDFHSMLKKNERLIEKIRMFAGDISL